MYMSALKSNKSYQNISELPEYEWNKFTIVKDGIVGRYDISKGLPTIYAGCDVFYADLAWSRGVNKFAELAGTEVEFKKYMEKITEIARNNGNPFYLVAGKEVEKYMIGFAYTDIKLNGDSAVLYSVNAPLIGNNLDSVELLELLALKHDRIGDFCCGMGRSGRIFKEKGKKFVMTDINGRCIEYLARKYEQN